MSWRAPPPLAVAVQRSRPRRWATAVAHSRNTLYGMTTYVFMFGRPGCGVRLTDQPALVVRRTCTLDARHLAESDSGRYKCLLVRRLLPQYEVALALGDELGRGTLMARRDDVAIGLRQHLLELLL